MIIPIPNRKILDPIIRAAKASVVYIQPIDGHVELGARSLDGYLIRRTAPAPGSHPATPISVPVESLARLLKAAPKKELLELSIVYSGDAPRVSARAGKAAFDLPAKYAADDAPPRFAGELGRSIYACPVMLARQLSRALPAMSKDATRPHLHGVMLESYGRGLRAIATNGHWMALAGGAGRAYTVEDVEDDPPIERALIPGAIVPHILRGLPGAIATHVETDGASTRVEIRDDDGWVTYGVTGDPADDIAFPPWRKIVPDAISAARTVTLSWDELLDAARMVEPFGAPNAAGNLITICAGADELRVAAESEIGRTHTDVSAEVIERLAERKESKPIGFASRYFLDALGVVASDEDRASIWIYPGDVDPVVFVSPDREYLAVVMPVRI